MDSTEHAADRLAIENCMMKVVHFGFLGMAIGSSFGLIGKKNNFGRN